ncbi:F-box only protein 15 [Eublepharis macularius]|uniref:F-box only protein 15 n=1 Tax=Eublepharis macularius TaxID=481883 RepID=A0AA97JM12_EUBMA|nr:F-box only protein 15 [Eublepharis macularius]
MATGRGWILQQHTLGASCPAVLSSIDLRRPPSRQPASFVLSIRESSDPFGSPARDSTVSKCSPVTTMQSSEIKAKHIQKQHWKKPFIKLISTTGIKSLPSEIILKIFSYLDAVSLLCTGCVNKHFYHLSSDNTIWLKIYSQSFLRKKSKWKTETVQNSGVSLSLSDSQHKESGYWKKEYIIKKIASGKAGIIHLLKSVNTYTGLPVETKNAIKVSGLRWMIILKERSGNEHVMDQADISFNETSLTVCWYGINCLCLDNLLCLRLYGVTPVLGEGKLYLRNGPWRRSLISEYQLANVTQNADIIGCDALVELYRVEEGVLLGLWNKNEIAFVMVCLHYHQLIERSILGSATMMHVVAPHKAVLDDIDPEYGLHGYQLHIDMHNKGNTYMCGTFRSLFCRKDYIKNGYLRLTVISYKNNSQHLPLVGKVGLSWKTDALEGIVQNCFIMDVTVLDESQKPFWCFSAPVNMETTSRAPDLNKYFGPSYYLNYTDSIGKVHVEMVWMEETQEYYITNLVLYLSTQKVNSWFGRNYGV